MYGSAGEQGRCSGKRWAVAATFGHDLGWAGTWALHTILAAGRKLRGAGGTVTLANPSDRVRRILELTGAGRLVPVCGSGREAVGD